MAIERSQKALLAFAFLICEVTLATAATPPTTLQLSPAFRELARASAYIFVGTVTSVSVNSPGVSTLPTIAVTFRVQRPYRGVRMGQLLQIKEWAGLWNSGQGYTVGEKTLIFLYPPSKLGLTSIVGQPAGRIRASRSGFILSIEGTSTGRKSGGKRGAARLPGTQMKFLAIIVILCGVARAGGPQYVAGSSYFDPAAKGAAQNQTANTSERMKHFGIARTTIPLSRRCRDAVPSAHG